MASKAGVRGILADSARALHTSTEEHVRHQFPCRSSVLAQWKLEHVAATPQQHMHHSQVICLIRHSATPSGNATWATTPRRRGQGVPRLPVPKASPRPKTGKIKRNFLPPPPPKASPTK